ncbi:MAG: hypothetical protein QXZ70_06760, partial [Candidatus Bathyarchaeia archaeon]
MSLALLTLSTGLLAFLPMTPVTATKLPSCGKLIPCSSTTIEPEPSLKINLSVAPAGTSTTPHSFDNKPTDIKLVALRIDI